MSKTAQTEGLSVKAFGTYHGLDGLIFGLAIA
jgi:hypothetical protein